MRIIPAGSKNDPMPSISPLHCFMTLRSYTPGTSQTCWASTKNSNVTEADASFRYSFLDLKLTVHYSQKNAMAKRASKRPSSKTQDDPEQSKLFIEKAREIEADEERSAADKLVGHLATKAPEPRKPKKKQRAK